MNLYTKEKIKTILFAAFVLVLLLSLGFGAYYVKALIFKSVFQIG